MAGIVWDVQPYALVSELANAYTRTVISTTRRMADGRAAEAEEWMKKNAPWTDRSEFLRAKLRSQGARVPEQHAREALSVTPVVNPNVERHYAGRRRQAEEDDKKLLAAENFSRATRSEGRSPSKRLSPLTSLPASRSRVAAIEQEIRAERGPIVELRFSHGEEIWYGVWLEVAHQGRYNIIARAINHWGPILQNDLKRIANLVQFNITFGETTTEAQRFMQHVESANQALLEGGETRRYQPWTAERQIARRLRRKRYRREKESAREKFRQAERAAREQQEALIRESTRGLYKGETPAGTFRPAGTSRRRR